MFVILQLLLGGLLLDIITRDAVYSSPLHHTTMEQYKETALDSVTTINSKHLEQATSFISEGQRASILSNSYSTESSFVATEKENEIKSSPEQNFNISIRFTKRAAPDSVYNSNDALDLKKEREGETRASSVPFLPSAKESGGTGGSTPGLSSIPGLNQVSGMIQNSSSSAPEAKLVMGGFSFMIMPVSASQMAGALQTGQQLSGMVPGMPSLPG